MGIFKTKKNKKYNYTPRFYKGERSPFEIKHKFDDQRVTIQKTNLDTIETLNTLGFESARLCHRTYWEMAFR